MKKLTKELINMVQEENVELIKKILDNRDRLNESEVTGETSLKEAAEKGLLAVLRYLEKSGDADMYIGYLDKYLVENGIKKQIK